MPLHTKFEALHYDQMVSKVTDSPFEAAVMP